MVLTERGRTFKINIEGGEQLPEVFQEIRAVCERFNVKNHFRVIVIASGETNALALRFARKRVVVIFSELLEGLVENPAELRALLAHETCHCVLDHGARGYFELYKPARYKAARELTCDNAAFVAAGEIEAAVNMVKKLCVGKRLFGRLSEDGLIAEAGHLYSGLIGWFLSRYLTHPPAGRRILNLREFAGELGVRTASGPLFPDS